MRIRKSRRWLALPAVLLVCGLFANHRLHVAWEEMIAQGRELEQEVELLDWTRPVLFGASTEGLAHLEYQRAMQLVSTDVNEEWIAWRIADREGDPSAAELRANLVAKNESMLQAMSAGAHRRDARPEFSWEDGLQFQGPKLARTRNMVNVAILASHQHMDEGRPDLAVDRLLDAMQFGRDIMNSGMHISTMIGNALLAISNEALVGSKRSPSGLLIHLPLEQVQRLAAGMRILDESFTSDTSAATGELARFIRTVNNLDEDAAFGSSWDFSDVGQSLVQYVSFGPLGRWRFLNYVREVARLRSFEGRMLHRPWEEVLASAEGELLYDGLPDQYINQQHFVLRAMVETPRTALTTFRLARTAVEFRLTGELPDLRDPFGTEFLVAEAEDFLVVQSLGPKLDEPGDYYAISLIRRGPARETE